MKVPFQTALLLDKLFSDMVRVVDCHAGVLGLKPGGPKTFSPGNYFSAFNSIVKSSGYFRHYVTSC